MNRDKLLLLSATASERITKAINYEYASSLPLLLDRLQLSIAFSSYQAGCVVVIGTYKQRLRINLYPFNQAMGICRTPSGLAICTKDSIWNLPANIEIARRIKPEGEHDIAFIARTSHLTGPVMGHDLAWCEGKLWLANTLFNGLVTIEDAWSFVPQWKPSFISNWAPEDRCHLNGFTVSEDGVSPMYATALANTNIAGGWRDQKKRGGIVMHIPSSTIIIEGLSMPHSPCLYRDALYVLNSGHGRIEQIDQISGTSIPITTLPGFTRGIDCCEGLAFIGISKIRESAVFSELPISQTDDELCCGIEIVDLNTGAVVGMLHFQDGIEEISAVAILPGWRNPTIVAPNSSTNDSQTIWIAPPHSM
jgi:uncharacterized protein (TIGR03032 family)